MATQVRKTLEQSIRDAIQAAGKSVNALAKDAGVPQAVLQRFVSGKRRGLTLETAEKLCAYLRLELKPAENSNRKKKTPDAA